MGTTKHITANSYHGKPGKKINYFHCYATANDSRLYIKDFMNLLRIKRVDSGVDQVCLFVAISKVRPINIFDQWFVKVVRAMFKNHPKVRLAQVFYKTNIGRDFSSYQALVEKVKPKAKNEDYIFFQNRSGYGPFRDGWYKQFVEQFKKFDSVALCGSTINFYDHPSRSKQNNRPHVQTYAFLSTMQYMNMLNNDFPGARETERLKVITQGEIGLSQFFLNQYKITCMEWPDLAITNQTPAPHIGDVKADVKADHFFYHRRYFKKMRRWFGWLKRRVK